MNISDICEFLEIEDLAQGRSIFIYYPVQVKQIKI